MCFPVCKGLSIDDVGGVDGHCISGDTTENAGFENRRFRQRNVLGGATVERLKTSRHN